MKRGHVKPVHPSKVGQTPTTSRKKSGNAPGRDWPTDNKQSSNGAITSYGDIHRTLPHSVEAEKGIIGSILISPRDAIGECVEWIESENWFYIPAHITIYTILVELWRDHQVFDLLIFTQILRDRNLLETLGGAGFITSLFTFVPTAANLEYYVAIVRDKYILRQAIAAGTEIVRRAFEEQDEVNEFLSEIERKVLSIRPTETTRQRNIKNGVMEALEGIEKLYESKGAVTGVSTGFIEIDRLTNGLQAQEMIVIAARPSMGKTALAMNIAEHATINLKLPTLVFSLEMSEQQLIQRALCSRARVNLQKVRDGFLSERDFPSLTAAAAKIAESPLHIIDEKLYIDSLVAKARRLKVEHGIGLIIVDYLQLLRARGFKPSEREREVAHISGSLKGIAKDLNIPIIVIAQLNRQPEARGGGKPRTSDLRESGSIEQDADVIALLVRGEMYEDDINARIEKAGEAELIIAKQRMGPVGEVMLTFLKEFTRFEDRAHNIQREL